MQFTFLLKTNFNIKMILNFVSTTNLLLLQLDAVDVFVHQIYSEHSFGDPVWIGRHLLCSLTHSACVSITSAVLS